MFRDLVKANRSYRGYDGSYQIDRDKLLSYVDLTRYAASSLNIQPLKYHIACEKEEVAKILPLTKFAARLAHLHLPHEGMNPTAFKLSERCGNRGSDHTPCSNRGRAWRLYDRQLFPGRAQKGTESDGKSGACTGSSTWQAGRKDRTD